jgi:hypothetical protein
VTFEVKNGPKTKNILSKSNLKEPIIFKMVMSTIRVNIFGGKGRKPMDDYFINIGKRTNILPVGANISFQIFGLLSLWKEIISRSKIREVIVIYHFLYDLPYPIRVISLEGNPSESIMIFIPPLFHIRLHLL